MILFNIIGLFRVLRIYIVYRKLNILRLRKEMRDKILDNYGGVFKSPMERVIEILNDVRDSLSTSEKRVIADLNYCIKMITTNKLYSTSLDFDDEN